MFTRKTRRPLLAGGALALTAALAVGCSGGSGGGEYDPEADVELTFAWWGNSDRADRYEALIEAFNEEHSNIKINGSFTDYPAFWEKRQTEAAGGGLPDVMQFDYSYLRQYAGNGLLADLGELSDYADTSAISDGLLATGQIEGTQYLLPLGYSTWAVFLNDDILAEYDIEPYAGGTTYEEYSEWMAEVTEATDGEVYGGTDYTQRIQNFEMKLRAEGGGLFTEEGELGFTEDDLREFWEGGAADRDGVVVPQKALEEINPVSGFGGNLTASEASWSNFIASYLGDSGAESISIVAPPTFEEGSQDLYQQSGLQMGISAQSDHPEAAAIFLDYVVNSPEAGELFGTSLGFPASETKLEGATLEGPDQQVADFLASVEDRLGEAPAAPVEGYSSLEQKFWDLGKELGLGTMEVDAAVEQFFSEADVLLDN
ncbi:ABC transporter substrate-binding protein [Microbacterium sp. G2-8]|uniref:ABC transporter substrate-binding protein n=1 Tax=Microbacterium sp. G2-8 TaxID=2842454 RepID=UPI001C8A4299|nr:extracellular solute-binding protein [Microbacterium sp. G2-8]